jgi:RND family efflux transporter MFP subunit
VRAAELNVRDSKVTAPMDGVVQTRTVETGQYVQAGFLMATLVQADPLLLRFSVYPLDAPRVAPGMSVDFTLKEKPESIFHAKITLVDAAADDTTHMVGVTAQVDTEQNKHWLRPGSFADVTLNVGGTRDYVIIPGSAIRGSDRGEIVFVVKPDNTVEQRVLTLGETTKDGFVEVRQGLKPGDKLVIRGQQPLVDGSAVSPNDVPAPESTAIPADSASAAPAASGSAAPAPSASASPHKAPEKK